MGSLRSQAPALVPNTSEPSCLFQCLSLCVYEVQIPSLYGCQSRWLGPAPVTSFSHLCKDPVSRVI